MLVVMETGNKSEINQQLALLKEHGIIQFDRVLSIPNHERIQGIVAFADGRMRVSAVLSASIKSAFDNMNLRVGMNEDQIFDLAEQIIDESAEDNLSIEDVLLFLKDLISGKAGKIFDRMDMPTFLELFEKYRQERHESLMNIREEQQSNHKAFGNPDRWSETHDKESENSMHEAMKEYMKMQAKNDEEQK